MRSKGREQWLSVAAVGRSALVEHRRPRTEGRCIYFKVMANQRIKLGVYLQQGCCVASGAAKIDMTLTAGRENADSRLPFLQ